MAISVKSQAAVPPGAHTGIIVSAEETKKVFNPQKGPEDTIEIVIQPRWRKDDATETLPVQASFTPVLNGLSALSKLLRRLDAHPTDGEAWEPSTLVGTEVAFSTKRSERDFVQVLKDTIRAAPQGK